MIEKAFLLEPFFDKTNISDWKFDIESNFTKNEFKFILYELLNKSMEI